jgi:hypothetical protein
MAELLQESTWTGWVISASHDPDVISKQWCSFPRWQCPHSQFSHGLKGMKVNFNIFPGQHNHQIWISLNHSGQF